MIRGLSGWIKASIRRVAWVFEPGSHQRGRPLARHYQVGVYALAVVFNFDHGQQVGDVRALALLSYPQQPEQAVQLISLGLCILWRLREGHYPESNQILGNLEADAGRTQV